MFSGSRILLPLTLLLIAIAIWAHLDELPVLLWDESRMAMNSYEMYKTHNWLVTTYHFEPEMWNTKPPLLIWLQAISYMIFGVNELALRLPSALAGTFTCLFIFWFLAKKMQQPLTGFLTIFILLTSQGYIKYHHSARSGDYDALLTMFTTFAALSYYTFLEEGKQKHLFFTCIGFTLAVMTKATAGLFFMPGILIYTLYKKQFLKVVRSQLLYLGLFLFIVIVGSYYYARNNATPGYLEAVMKYDLLGRAKGETGDRADGDAFFYYNLLSRSSFNFWYLLLPVGIGFGAFATDKRIKDLSILSMILCGTVLLVISKAGIKKDWYDISIYPFFSFLAALGLVGIYNILQRTELWKPSLSRNVLPLILLLVLMIPPFMKAVHDSFYPDPGEWIQENTMLTRFLKDIYHNEPKPTEPIYIAYNEEYVANAEWYINVLKDKNVTVKFLKYEELAPPINVWTYQWKFRERINDFDNDLNGTGYGDHMVRYHLNSKK